MEQHENKVRFWFSNSYPSGSFQACLLQAGGLTI
jgi:hypothetical protein